MFEQSAAKNESNTDIGAIPVELATAPLSLVFFTGLDVVQNETHHKIWEQFTVKDQSLVNYRLVDDNIQIQPVKGKKSYDWHVPKGILKTTWLSKHLYHIPSVLVFFIELDWDDLNFKEKSLNLVARLNPFREKLANRSTEIVVVLIQQNLTMPNDDSLSKERATVLCDLCDISVTSLLVLPVQDQGNFGGYISRMKSAFLELSNVYYAQKMKIVKSHRELLNKTTHTFLFVRHQLKLAFFSEMRQEHHIAIKSYKQAYVNLMEVRPSGTNHLEIKTIAGFINYKICRLQFLVNEPREAISHFQKHISIFKDDYGGSDGLVFEHHAWLSKQFSIFGEIFDEATKTANIKTTQIQHPGHYFYEAALHAINRYRESYQFVKQVAHIETPPTILSEGEVKFYGQRPWRPGSQCLKPLDMDKENEAVLALKYQELNHVNHTGLIINLLAKSMSQFKKNRCPRMMRYMMVLMANEYYLARDYENVLNYLNQVLPSYRAENWKTLLVSLLTTMVESAFMSANYVECVRLGLEYLSVHLPIPEESRNTIRDCIETLMKGKFPSTFSLTTSENFSLARQIWSKTAMKELNLILKINNVMPLIEVKPVFKRPSFHSDENVEIDIHMRSMVDIKLHFSKMELIFSENFYNTECEKTYDEKNDVISVGETRCESFSFAIRRRDANKELKIIGMKLTLCERPNRIVLNWIFDGIHGEISGKKRFLYNLSSSANVFDEIEPLLVTTIAQVQPLVKCSVIFEPIFFINENFPLNLQLKNNEKKHLDKVSFTIQVSEKFATLFTACQVSVNGERYNFGTEISLVDKIEPDGEFEKRVLIVGCPTGEDLSARLTVDFKFTISGEPNSGDDIEQSFKLSESVKVAVQSPFSWSFELLNVLRLPAKSLRRLEPFVLKVVTTKRTSIPIEVISVSTSLASGFKLLETSESPINTNNHKIENERENFTDEFTIYSDQALSVGTSIGQLVINWHRLNGTEENECRTYLPQVNINESLLFVETVLPKLGVTKQHSIMSFSIYNRTNAVLPLELSIGNSENFMFAGNKLVRLEINPNEKSTQYYVLYPLVYGNWALPKLSIIAFPGTVNEVSMEKELEDVVPSHLYVMPHERTAT